jgi:hypothetical protein
MNTRNLDKIYSWSYIHFCIFMPPRQRVPQWKLTSDALAFLVESSSAACFKSILSKIRGYHRSVPMGMVFMFPGNYCVGEGNTINKSFSISSLLLNASRLIKLL